MQNNSYKISKKKNISYINIIGSMQNVKFVNIYLIHVSISVPKGSYSPCCSEKNQGGNIWLCFSHCTSSCRIKAKFEMGEVCHREWIWPRRNQDQITSYEAEQKYKKAD